jgi:tyrosinase
LHAFDAAAGPAADIAVQYWDYGRWADDPLGSPLFDGSEYSLGGNGAPVSQTAGGGGGGFGSFGGSPAPPGVGGGCISTGPFKK